MDPGASKRAARKIPGEALRRPHPRAVRPGGRESPASLRGSETCGEAAALRLPPGVPGLESGRPRGPLPTPRKTFGSRGRDQTCRVCRLQRGDPGGTRAGDSLLGPGALDRPRDPTGSPEGKTLFELHGTSPGKWIGPPASTQKRTGKACSDQGARRFCAKGEQTIPGIPPRGLTLRSALGTHPRGRDTRRAGGMEAPRAACGRRSELLASTRHRVPEAGRILR